MSGEFQYFLCAIGGGDQGYGSGRYDSRPGGYGYGYGRSRDYGGRWVAKGLGGNSGAVFLKSEAAWVIHISSWLVFAFTN